MIKCTTQVRIVVLLVAVFVLSGCGRIEVPGDAVVIRNGTIIDGTGREPVAGGLVVVKDGKIWGLGKEQNFSVPRGVQVFNAKKGYILPGLIDTHTHISNTKHLQPWMMAGVTTVRDLGGPKGIILARKWTRSDTEPRLVVSGPILTVPGGYPIPAWGDKSALTINNPRDAAIVVEGLIEEGVDVIKIAVTEGMDKQPWPTLSMDEIKAITSTAHKHGIKVAAHVLRAKDARRAIEGGVDQLAHDVIDELPQELLMTMVDKQIIMIPTLEVLMQGVEKSTQFTEQERREARENLLLNVKRFAALGGSIALGDDFGVVGVAMDLPMQELQLMQQAGLTPMQVINSSTQIAARALAKEGELGTLEAGKTADILVTKNNPLQDLRNLTPARGVMFKGKVIFWQDTS